MVTLTAIQPICREHGSDDVFFQSAGNRAGMWVCRACATRAFGDEWVTFLDMSLVVRGG